MRNRSSWLVSLTAAVACVALIVGVAVPGALGAPKGKPGVTPPGVPPGQPFIAIVNYINGLVAALDARITALEAAAPTAGPMWVNPFDFVATAGTVGLAAAGTATPGLVVSTLVLAADTLQAGAQVPRGFKVTGAMVCFTAGAGGGFVSDLTLTQNAPTSPFTSTALAPGTVAFASPGASTGVCRTLTLTTPVDPNSTGPVYLAIGVSFSAADSLTIRGIALQLEPV